MTARTQIPADVAADILFASDRICCMCEVRGKAVQIHHLDGNSSNHSPKNLAVLCLECHNQTQTRGGFGRHASKEVVTKFRDEWAARVRERRRTADRLAAELTLRLPSNASVSDDEEVREADMGSEDVLDYINTLPDLRAELLESAQPEWDSGTTARMVQASYDVIDALSGILVALSGCYSDEHSWRKDPHRFFSEQIAARFEWHRSHIEPEGPGTGGTIVNNRICSNVQEDVEKMVENMVMSLVGYDDRFDWRGWPRRWRGKK